MCLERLDLTVPRTFSHGQLPEGAYLRVSVTPGTGIAPELVDRIFDPFFTTKRVGEGTGLGLSLVHGIVADLGGAIELDSRVGRGTTVRIWLPVSGEVASAVAESPRELPHGRGETVLIVDDEPTLVAVTEEILAELGYEPIGVVSSTGALTVFRAEPRRFDAVLTDEIMPGILGTQLAREFLALRPDNSDTPDERTRWGGSGRACQNGRHPRGAAEAAAKKRSRRCPCAGVGYAPHSQPGCRLIRTSLRS